MDMDRELLRGIWETFLDETVSDTKLDMLLNAAPNHRDAMAFLLLKTDFLQQQPKVAAILKELAPVVSRCLLDAPASDRLVARNLVLQSVYNRLLEEQQKYATQAQALVSMERRIFDLKYLLAALEGHSQLGVDSHPKKLQ